MYTSWFFNLPRARKFIFSLKFDLIWPIFPNDSESLPKVCYIKQKNSEILSKLRNSEPAGGSVSRRKKVSPYISWKCHVKTKANSYHDFNHIHCVNDPLSRRLAHLISRFQFHFLWVWTAGWVKIRLHWNHLLLQSNICLCLDSAVGRREFFRQGTWLGSWPT